MVKYDEPLVLVPQQIQQIEIELPPVPEIHVDEPPVPVPEGHEAPPPGDQPAGAPVAADANVNEQPAVNANAPPPLPPPPIDHTAVTWNPCSADSRRMYEGSLFYSVSVSVFAVPLLVMGVQNAKYDFTTECPSRISLWARGFGGLLLAFGLIVFLYPLVPLSPRFRKIFRFSLIRICLVLFCLFTFYGFYCTWSNQVGEFFGGASIQFHSLLRQSFNFCRHSVPTLWYFGSVTLIFSSLAMAFVALKTCVNDDD